MADENRACLRCGAIFKEGSSYCARCGAPVVNRCTDQGDLLNDPCGHVCGFQDAFCSKCGSETTFKRAGLIRSPWTENKALYQNHLDDMKWLLHPFFTKW